MNKEKRIEKLEKIIDNIRENYYNLQKNINMMLGDLYVKDSLVEIGEASGKTLILKSDSVKFSALHWPNCGYMPSYGLYTTKQNYKNHKPLIDGYKKQLIEWEKKNNKTK